MSSLALDPATTALVLVDLQNGVAGDELAPFTFEDVAGQCVRLLAAARAADLLVIHVRSSHLPTGGDRLRVVNDLSPRPHRPAEAGGDQLVDLIDRRDTEPLVTKRSWNAFYGTDLDLQLRRHGMRTVILAGVTTNFGVEGTGRNAVDHGYEAVFVSDAMTAPSAELHEFATTKVMPFLGRVRTADQVLSALTGAQRAGSVR